MFPIVLLVLLLALAPLRLGADPARVSPAPSAPPGVALPAPKDHVGVPLAASSRPPATNAPPTWETLFAERRQWWSFQPVRKPALPAVRDTTWSSHPVDRFVLARQEARGLHPAPEAQRAALFRRLTFVLTGLPPAPEATRAFLADANDDAYDRAVDRLLASPQFGERWARHWMDLVRYCESHGSQGDPELPMAWRYRDYLVRAFNADVPYDQFVREHLAGDLLPRPRLNAAEGLDESILGTAQLRMVEFGFVPVDALDDQVKVVDNQIDVFSKAFLGLTVACARCHDHKFDPITQKDFYALYGVFASGHPGQVVVDAPELRRTNRAELAALKTTIRSGLADAWIAAAPRLPAALLEHDARTAALAAVDADIARLGRELASVERRARSELARARHPAATNTVPAPLARWTFEDDLRDDAGAMHGHAEGGAVVRDGRLVLNGKDAWVVTDPLPAALREKTLEVWVTLAGLEQRGGGVLTVQTPDSNVFDSIVIGEREPGHWIAGSDGFNRTRDIGGPAETAKPNELVHIAIAHGADNSIALYRDGKPYGQAYRHGTLAPFASGSARVVLGKRHLGAGIAAFAGEVEEARVYARALSADEIAASFRAGPVKVDAAALAAALTPAERRESSVLHQRLGTLEARRQALRGQETAGNPWTPALAAAAKNDADPLHPWVALSGLKGAAFRDGWQRLAEHWSTELASRGEFNRTNFTRPWGVGDGGTAPWFKPASIVPEKPAPPGGFSVEAQGERILRGLYPSAVFTHGLTRKEPGVLASPRFRVTTANISVRGFGEHSSARLVVENYAIGNGGIYPASTLGNDETAWTRLDTAYRKGANAYLEFVTAEDFPSPGLRSNGRPYEDGRAYFGAVDVVFHDGPNPPRETRVPAAFLLASGAPASAEELAGLYGRLLADAAARWRDGTLDDASAAFLDAFVRRDLLPATRERLPALGEAVARYRALEQAIPVPRRAPGLHEAPAFDQPLFQRGQPDKPRDPVPRRFLEVLGGQPYRTPLSGRLELAGEVASAANPLTARVMVNRLWHHLFGRGLVGTVDNFGRLGEKPTHPELLDFLAARFVDRGWSVKDMVRFLVTSRTFRQSTVPSDAARQSDPANDWLSHARVHRLEAEAIRDAVLAVSGQLDPKMGGPGVNVHYVGKTEGGGPVGPLDGDRRRSLYQRIRRNAHNPFLEAFDAPKPTGTRGKRDATNVPAQSLALLNAPFVIGQAGHWARSLVGDGQNRSARVAGMIARALGRAATAEEVAASGDFLRELAAEHGVAESELEKSERVWQDFAQSLFCLKEFIYVD